MNSLQETIQVFIKRYYQNQILKGFGILLTIMLPLYLFFTFLEYQGHFSTLVRAVIFYTFILVAFIIIYQFVLVPLLRLKGFNKNRIQLEDAAIIIGRYFPEISDKLLNTIQLNELNDGRVNNPLLTASIEQKMKEMRPFNFFLAIDKSETIKYFRFAAGAIVLLLVVALFQGSVLRESSVRIVQYNKQFIRKAPFIFHFNEIGAVKSGSSVPIRLKLIGDEVPEVAFLKSADEWIQMKKQGPNEFGLELKNISKSRIISFKAGEFQSQGYEIQVVSPPSLTNIQIDLKYPSYTKRKNEKLNTTSSLLVPEGTSITWNLLAKNTDSLKFAYNQKWLEGEGFFMKKVTKNGAYTILLQNNLLQQTDTIQYGVEVVKDQFPTIRAKSEKDSLSEKTLYFFGSANDDYGLTQLWFHYQLVQEDGSKSNFKKIKVPLGKGTNELFSFVFDLNQLKFELGSTIKCYFKVFDNDAINGSKGTKTETFIHKAPTAQELKDLSDQGHSDLVSQMDEAIKEAMEIQKLTQELRVKMNDSKSMSFPEKKAINNLLQKQKSLQERVKSIQQKQEKLRSNENDFKKVDPKIEEKQKILDDMFKKTMSQEMKDLFKKLEELLKDENKQEISKQLDKMNQADKDMSKQLDRLQEQLKQLELEKKIEETADKLEEMAKKQDTLQQKTQDKNQNQENLIKQQDQLKNEFEEVKKDLNKIQELNNDLKNKMNLDSTQKEQNSIEQALENSKKELNKGKSKKAGEQQNKAKEEMKKLAEKMRQNLEMELKKREAEDYNTLRQLLENLIVLSHEQEKTMTELKRQPGYTPRFIELSKQQQKIKRDAEMIEDSLLALSKRNIKIQSFVNTEIGKINHHMNRTIDALSLRNQYAAAADQQYVMTSINNLAVMLSESLKNMQMQMNKKKNGQQKVGQCKNPGTGEGSNPSKPKSGGKNPSMGTLKELQQDLNKMSQERQQGKKNGSGENGSMTAEDFVRMANEQEALRKALEEVEKMLKEQGKSGALGDLAKTRKLMEQIEKDLVNKVLDENTIQRQKQIEIRLSQHEQAEIKQDQEEKRQAETAQEEPKRIPPNLEQYINELQRQQEILKLVPAEMAPYYQNKVQSYFLLL